MATDYKDQATVVGVDASAADGRRLRAGETVSVPVVKATTTSSRYRGQFGSDAPLSAVLQGKDVPVKATTPAG